MSVVHPTIQIMSVVHPTIQITSVVHPTIQIMSVVHPTIQIMSVVHPTIQITSVVHPTSHSTGKASRSNDDLTPPTSSDVRNEWNYTCTAPYYDAFKACTGTAVLFMTENIT
jgi:hypothetical protein